MNDATNWPITLENESNSDAAVFATTATNTTASATSGIAPDAHFLSSGLKLDTGIFLKGNINNMADKDTIDTTPSPDEPNYNTADAATQDAGSTESNSSFSLINHKLAPYSITTTKNQKKKEKKIDDKVTI